MIGVSVDTYIKIIHAKSRIIPWEYIVYSRNPKRVFFFIYVFTHSVWNNKRDP